MMMRRQHNPILKIKGRRREGNDGILSSSLPSPMSPLHEFPSDQPIRVPSIRYGYV